MGVLGFYRPLLLAAGATGAVLACTSFSASPAVPSPDASADVDAAVSDTGTGPDAQTSAYRAAILGDGPLAYWRMGTAGSVIPDETGGGNALLLQGTGHELGYAGAIQGDDDRAIRFDGFASYAVATDAGVFDFYFRRPFTLECWALRSARDEDQGDGGADVTHHLLGRYDVDAGSGYTLYLALGNPGRTSTDYLVPGKSVRSLAGPLIPPATWAHYAVVFDGNTMTLFVNGTLAKEQVMTDPLAKLESPFVVGRAEGPTGYWPGAIDEIAIYGKALTHAQILTHRDLGRKP